MQSLGLLTAQQATNQQPVCSRMLLMIARSLQDSTAFRIEERERLAIGYEASC